MIAPRIKPPIGGCSFPARCGGLLRGAIGQDCVQFAIDILPLTVCMFALLAFDLPPYLRGVVSGVCVANLYRLAVS